MWFKKKKEQGYYISFTVISHSGPPSARNGVRIYGDTAFILEPGELLTRSLIDQGIKGQLTNELASRGHIDISPITILSITPIEPERVKAISTNITEE